MMQTKKIEKIVTTVTIADADFIVFASTVLGCDTAYGSTNPKIGVFDSLYCFGILALENV